MGNCSLNSRFALFSEHVFEEKIVIYLTKMEKFLFSEQEKR